MEPPYVLKADGLAAGKGVLILNDLQKAKTELKDMLEGKKFGAASAKVVIEEFLSGIELSVFLITDGDSYTLLPNAKDYKRIGEGDTGLNTGGMGAISPVPHATDEFLKKVEDRVVIPTVEGLKQDNIDYTGFLFIGLMKVGTDPYVIEYNVRMGDPETEVVLPRLGSDFLDMLFKAGQGQLKEHSLEVDERTAATVMLVSKGYPEAYEKGFEITNINDVEGSIVFHAGTIKENDKIITNGGRVLAVTSFGRDMEEALDRSYSNAKVISFNNKHYRKDIGFDFIEKSRIT